MRRRAAYPIFQDRQTWLGTFVTGIIKVGDVVSALSLSPRPNPPIATQGSNTAGDAAFIPLRTASSVTSYSMSSYPCTAMLEKIKTPSA